MGHGKQVGRKTVVRIRTQCKKSRLTGLFRQYLPIPEIPSSTCFFSLFLIWIYEVITTYITSTSPYETYQFEQREVIALIWRNTYKKGHNNRDLKITQDHITKLLPLIYNVLINDTGVISSNQKEANQQYNSILSADKKATPQALEATNPRKSQQRKNLPRNNCNPAPKH